MANNKTYPLVEGGTQQIDLAQIQSITSTGETTCKVEMAGGVVHQIAKNWEDVNKDWAVLAEEPEPETNE